METKDLVMNEEVVEVVEEVAMKDSGKVLKKLGAIGAIAGGGYLIYRFAVKPIVKKIKARNEETVVDYDIDAAEIVESEGVEK